jgi:hypothetical protein
LLQANLELLLAAKAHKARCIKILATARKAIEEESEKLVGTFTKISMGLSPSPHQNSEPFTPSPTLQAPGGQYKLTQHHELRYFFPAFFITLALNISINRSDDHAGHRATPCTDLRRSFLLPRARVRKRRGIRPPRPGLNHFACEPKPAKENQAPVQPKNKAIGH